MSKVLLDEFGKFVGYSDFGIDIDFDFSSYVKGTNEEIKSAEINARKTYLSSTDHKMYLYYEPLKDEDIESIKAKRKEARDFIRNNNA